MKKGKGGHHTSGGRLKTGGHLPNVGGRDKHAGTKHTGNGSPEDFSIAHGYNPGETYEGSEYKAGGAPSESENCTED